MQFIPENGDGLPDLPVRGVTGGRESEESMDHRRGDSQPSANSGFLQPSSELASFVKEWIVCGQMNERRRHAGEVRRVDGAGVPMASGRRIRAIVIPEPGHGSTFQQESLRELEHAWSIEVRIGSPDRSGIGTRRVQRRSSGRRWRPPRQGCRPRCRPRPRGVRDRPSNSPACSSAHFTASRGVFDRPPDRGIRGPGGNRRRSPGIRPRRRFGAWRHRMPPDLRAPIHRRGRRPASEERFPAGGDRAERGSFRRSPRTFDHARSPPGGRGRSGSTNWRDQVLAASGVISVTRGWRTS